MRAALSEMTKNMGDSWGRTPERGHIHQLYCHPPFSNHVTDRSALQEHVAPEREQRVVEQQRGARGEEGEMRKGRRWED